jgi:MFS family permease
MSGGGVRRGSGSWLFVLLLFAFGFFGLFWGAFAVLLADLSGALGLSPGPLGFALFVGAAASILAMALLGRIADRLGRRPFLVASAGVFGAGIVGLALTGSYMALLAALVTLYAASGLYAMRGVEFRLVAPGKALHEFLAPVAGCLEHAAVPGEKGQGLLREALVEGKREGGALVVDALRIHKGI